MNLHGDHIRDLFLELPVFLPQFSWPRNLNPSLNWLRLPQAGICLGLPLLPWAGCLQTSITLLFIVAVHLTGILCNSLECEGGSGKESSFWALQSSLRNYIGISLTGKRMKDPLPYIRTDPGSPEREAP